MRHPRGSTRESASRQRRGTLRGRAAVVKQAACNKSIATIQTHEEKSRDDMNSLLPRYGVLLLAAAGLSASACVREKEAAPKKPAVPAQSQSAPRPGPAEYDIEGKRRAKPRATMGAIEADPTPPRKRQPPDKPVPKR